MCHSVYRKQKLCCITLFFFMSLALITSYFVYNMASIIPLTVKFEPCLLVFYFESVEKFSWYPLPSWLKKTYFGCMYVKVAQSCLTLWPHGLYTPWNSPGQNTGVGSLFLLQGIFPTQGSNSGLLHCRRILNQLSHKGSPVVCVCVCVYICMCVCVYLYIYIFSSYNDFVFISDWLVW